MKEDVIYQEAHPLLGKTSSIREDLLYQGRRPLLGKKSTVREDVLYQGALVLATIYACMYIGEGLDD